MHLPPLGPLHLYGLVRGLVALQLVGPGGLVSHEPLVALEDQYGSVDQVEMIFGFLLDSVTVCEEVTRLLCPDIFPCNKVRTVTTILLS